MPANQRLLYTYILHPNDVLTAGLKSPVLMPAASLAHYAGRAGCGDKEAVMRYLESVFPGRSRAVSFLTERAPQTENKKISGFCMLRDCFMCNADVLEKSGRIEAVYCCDGAKVSRLESWAEMDFSPLAWDTVREDDAVFFFRIRHYMLVLKNGFLPPEYMAGA